MAAIYPMQVNPRFSERIWGGHALAREFGKDAPSDTLIGESWEVYDDNRITNGPYSGKTIAELREIMGRELMGHVPADTIFPLLTKLIDAAEALSVQVHPDDRFAQQLESQPNGKTECWYIVSAEPGSTLTYGFSRDTNPEEYVSLVRAGTLGEILHQVPVQTGDVFYIPSGTVHAIGAGIRLFELQQTSDVTYRIFDWNRRDASGKERELHVDKARLVLNYHGRTGADAIVPLRTPDGTAAVLVAGPYFTLEHLRLDGGQTLDTHDSPVVLCALDSKTTVSAGSMDVQMPAYSSAVIPAAAGSFTVRSARGDGGHCLVAYVPASLDATRNDLLHRGIPAEQVDTFLAQFGTPAHLGEAATSTMGG